ncbi:threonine-phosphate decarboxylase [Butyricicoccus pullicaecorum]|nr:threonine-phosphate decarboxylase [Butyricicoccus pullicaecorum]
MRYTHGGDVYTYAERFGHEALDFSANINPRGIPERVRRAMRAAVDDCTRYPDPFCRELTAALAARWRLTSDQIFCGNGAADIFFRLADCIRPKTALLPAPTFGEYEAALTRQGCDIRYHTLYRADGFALTERVLDELTDEVDIFFLCNPNNPTGRTADPALCEQIVWRCLQHDIWLVADECFGDFLIDQRARTLRPWLDTWQKLVIVRAFTKMYAVPGVRLGFCMTANRGLIEQLYAAGQPWPVSVIAQACGTAALSCEDWESETARQIADARKTLAAGLSACGLTVFPGEVNYLLFYTDRHDLRERLLPYGIMIRDCANYRGLGPGYFRVAVKREADNKRLIETIQEVLSGG